MSSETPTPEQVRKTEIVNLVLRQTDYTEDEAREHLESNDYNYLNVIKNYMNISEAPKETNNKSINQQIYSEIRSFMDTGVEKYERNKRIQERIESMRQLQYLKQKAQEQEAQKQQQTTGDDTETLETVTEENNSEEVLEGVTE